AYAAKKEDVVKLNKQTGDLGITAQRLAPASKRKSPTVVEAHARLYEIAKAGGAGSQQKKLDGFTSLLADLDATSAKHLVRITLGKMRLGIGDPTVLDALSFAKKGDRSLRPVLEAAYNRTSDLGLIARTLWERAETGLDALKVRAGHPLRPQLAERLPNPEAVIKKLGTVGVQPKYDGLRVRRDRPRRARPDSAALRAACRNRTGAAAEGGHAGGGSADQDRFGAGAHQAAARQHRPRPGGSRGEAARLAVSGRRPQLQL